MARRRRIPPGGILLMVIVCVLLLALGGLAIYTVNKVDSMQNTIDRLRGDKATVTDGEDADKDNLLKELAEQKKTIEKQQKEMDKQQGTIEKQQGTIEEQQGTIDEQQGTIDEQKDTIEQQQATIEKQENTIDKQQNTIDDLKVQIALKNTEPGDPNLPVLGPFDDYEGQKIVALTFDDGPGPYTAELLDFLKQEDVKATFFVLGTRVDAYPSLIRRMAAEGHEIGNHSNAHNMLHKMDLVGIRNEMGKCAEKVEKLLGFRPSVMRCPGGNKNNAVHQYATEAGIPIAYWSVDTRDWESKNKDKILEVAFGKNGIKDGSIVLMHDIYKTTVAAAKEMILRLKEEGYVFVTTSELIAARRGGIVPGKQYN